MKRILFVIVIALSLSGCEYLDLLSKNSEQLSRQEEEIQNLKASLSSLQSELSTIKTRQLELEWANMYEDFKHIAFLKPGNSGYSTITFPMGVLTVSLDDIKQYANGTKVKLRFGNTLYSSISGVKAKLEWGGIDSDGTVIDDPNNTKDVSFTEDFKPGSWTSVSVVLDNIQPSDLGFVRIKNLTNDSIYLQK
ncbi:MAG TPA: hypothetical protein DCG34_06465 [Clostridiales bacterium]|jgi:hypothetical protein|nr:hypothetical protein [Clostridiales bacterium]